MIENESNGLEFHATVVLKSSLVYSIQRTKIEFIILEMLYSKEYTGVFCHFYMTLVMTLVHIFRGTNSISRAHLQGESFSIVEMHIPRERRHCVNQKTLFCLFSCWLYGALSYVLLFSLHHVYALDMHISLCYCAHLNACSDDHLFCYVIIVVISI